MPTSKHLPRMNGTYGYQLSLPCGSTYSFPNKSPPTLYSEPARLSLTESESSYYQHFVFPDRPTEPSPPFSDTISQASSQDSQASSWENLTIRTTTSTPASIYPGDDNGPDHTFDFGQLVHHTLSRHDQEESLTGSWLGTDFPRYSRRHGSNDVETSSTTQVVDSRCSWSHTTEESSERVTSFEQRTLPIRPHVLPKVAGLSRSAALSNMVDSQAPAASQQPAAHAPRRREKLSSTCHYPPHLRRDTDNTNSMVRCIVTFCTNLIQHIASDPEASVASCSSNVLPLETFIKETLRRSKTSYSTLQIALYYLMLAKEKRCQPPIVTHRVMRCGRRLFLTALILASKYLQDRNYSARAWSKISGLPLQEINENERQCLSLINWDLHVPKDHFENWCNLVLSFGRADASHEQHWSRRYYGDATSTTGMSRQDHAYDMTRLNWWRQSLSMLRLSMVKSHQSVTQAVQHIYRLRLHMFTNSLRCINIAQWATAANQGVPEDNELSDLDRCARDLLSDRSKMAAPTSAATYGPCRSSIYDLLAPRSLSDSTTDALKVHATTLSSRSNTTWRHSGKFGGCIADSHHGLVEFSGPTPDNGGCPALRHGPANGLLPPQTRLSTRDNTHASTHDHASRLRSSNSAVHGLANRTAAQPDPAAVLASSSEQEELYFSHAESASYASDSAYESEVPSPDSEEYRKNGSKRKRVSNPSLLAADEIYKRARKFAVNHNTRDSDFYMARRQGVVTASSIEDRIYTQLDKKVQRRAKPAR